jgi:2-polyprenyl-3-methyl-5-hydroxy-6-metoxy-1,4-benzoquinol methylase
VAAIDQSEGSGEADAAYRSQAEAEIERYRNCVNVHDLPAMYDYWSNGHVMPLIEQAGAASFYDIWDAPFRELCGRLEHVRAISLGSGNGDFELGIATRLRAEGIDNFTIERLEFNPHMRERAAQDAAAAGLSRHFEETSADLNRWDAAGRRYDVVMAMHVLHHVVELERLFAAIKNCLSDRGTFIISDMIGRNGHMRWPAAMQLTDLIWRGMPDRYRYNHQSRTHCPEYLNIDYSNEGFEGVRAQDILPLLNDTFHPEFFVAFANVIVPFVDRGFGHNFDPDSPVDRAFIDSVAKLDEAALELGIVKPTILLARYQNQPTECSFVPPMSPSFAEYRPESRIS